MVVRGGDRERYRGTGRIIQFTLHALLCVWQVNQLYIIGGDGTHRGALRIAKECMQRVGAFGLLITCITTIHKPAC